MHVMQPSCDIHWRRSEFPIEIMGEVLPQRFRYVGMLPFQNLGDDA